MRRGHFNYRRLSPVEGMELLRSKMGKTKNNAEFLASMAAGK